ncbi:MAG: T9SS type A sorting domain-containing protein [Prevotellaceae bacterium]|jgi:glycosidase|nr:T9SS type A sorting domain-containing protein [Prevotellaceae bacterium]
MKKFSLTTFLTICVLGIYAQVVSTIPVVPIHNQAVTVIFDASKGTAGLKDFTGDVYAHTGVVTDKGSWRYANKTWGENLPKYQLTNKGNNKWELALSPNPREWYGVPDDEKILQLAFVFRSADSQKEGKDNGGKDIFIDVSEDNFNLAITSPTQNSLYQQGDTITISATSSETATLALYSNGVKIQDADAATEISSAISSLSKGSYTIVATAELDGAYRTDTVNFAVRDTVEITPLPLGMQDGVNYDPDDATKATLVLFAPHKEYVFVVGDFNSWTLQSEYQMKRDGDRFWLTLEGLTPSAEYAYQYYIDGSLYIADPYTEKVLDPWNDGYITSAVYPNLKPYPQKATGIVSVLQTAQTPYAWSEKSYARPAKEKLNIYELLVRDFVAAHTYSAIIDSLRYFKQLGINAIELLPTNEFEGNESWGYNPSFYFAPDKYYGPKNELKRLIDSCHANNIAVIIDMVLNHSFGLSPMVQMYWDAANNRPAANSPWFNAISPNSTYEWGSDFNHQSPNTQQFVDRVNCFWLTEYKVDGIRFDFTKGFTNTSGDGWNHDNQRIGILKRMYDAIRACSPDAYVIFEHLTANTEEKELANYGIMLWGNVNNNSCEAIMGYNQSGKSDLSAASYKSKGWNNPNLVAYMESHDEERMMYKAKQWGAASGSYSTKDETTALRRAGLCATVFFSIPGPKMLWQFGELGYDYSINACPDGTVGDCRTSNKAIRWDYYQNDSRKNLYYHYSEIMRLRQMYDAFSATDFSTSLRDTVKTVTLKGSDMNVIVVGNFGLTSKTASLTPPAQGAWYEYFSQGSSTAAALQSIALAPGEYRIYTDKKIDKLDISYATSAPVWYEDAPSTQLFIYPNPVQNDFNLTISNLKISGRIQLVIYNMLGQVVSRQYTTSEGGSLAASVSSNALSRGTYILSVQDSKGKGLISSILTK